MRLYRALLRLYPSHFREEYHDEMCRAFDERTRGHSRIMRVLMAIGDVVPNAIAARWDTVRLGAAAGTVVPAFAGDVRYALRQIKRAPLMSSVIIAVIALGIGINAGLLTVLNTYAWRPAPGIPADASLARIVPVATRDRGRFSTVDLSYSEIRELRRQRDVFADVVAFEPALLPVDISAGAEEMLTWYASANFFRSLRVAFAAGSGFPDDLDESNSPVAVISHSLWMTNFGGSRDAIGKTIRVMNRPFTIVGVAPPRFVGVDVMKMGKPAIWLPVNARALLGPTSAYSAERDGHFRAVARLAGGVNPNDIDHLTANLAVRFAQREPQARGRLSIRAERLTGIAQSDSNRTELVAAFLVVVVLTIIITCTNVSALLLGRAAARRREIGVRLSLGATRLRLIRQLLTESLVLAFTGAFVALALYIPTIKITYVLMPEAIYGLQPESATFFFAAAFAFVTTIVFGLAPALHATSSDIGEVMKNSGNHAIRRSRLQMIFVVAQLACSQPVLIVTSFVLADMRHGATGSVEPAPASVVTMSSVLYRPDSSAVIGPEPMQAVQRRLATIPGVRAAAIGTRGMEKAAMMRFAGNVTFDVPGGKETASRVRELYISADYFSALGKPTVRGRMLSAGDDRPGASVVVVSNAAAEALWPGENPIGKQLIRRTDGVAEPRPLEVIGVVGPAPYDPEGDESMVFAPLSTARSAWHSTIAVRTSSDARPYVPTIRAAIRDVEPYAAIDELTTLAERYAVQQRETVQQNAAAFAVGIAALVLASLGLYAIIAFAVAQRTREIGIRLAMGSTPRGIVRHFFRDGLIVSGIGLAIGLPITVAGIRIVQASLIGFTLQSVATVAVVVPVLLAVAGVASWLPARRAGRVDPVIALRSE